MNAWVLRADACRLRSINTMRDSNPAAARARYLASAKGRAAQARAVVRLGGRSLGHRAHRRKRWVIEMRSRHWRTGLWRVWHIWKRYDTRRDAEEGLKAVREEHEGRPYWYQFRRRRGGE